MAAALDDLLKALRAGEPGAADALVEGLRAADAAVLVALFADPNPLVRGAVVKAAVPRREAEVVAAVRAAVRDADPSVRAALAAADSRSASGSGGPWTRATSAGSAPT